MLQFEIQILNIVLGCLQRTHDSAAQELPVWSELIIASCRFLPYKLLVLKYNTVARSMAPASAQAPMMNVNLHDSNMSWRRMLHKQVQAHTGVQCLPDM